MTSRKTTIKFKQVPKKRAAEAEKQIEKIDMDDKEATPIEDIEGRLPPAEPNQPEQQEEQPEKHTQTGDVNLKEKELETSNTTENPILNKVMEMFLQISQKMNSTKEELSKERKEDNRCV